MQKLIDFLLQIINIKNIRQIPARLKITSRVHFPPWPGLQTKITQHGETCIVN